MSKYTSGPDFSFLNATPRTGLEGFQQAINESTTLLDKYLERENAKEERKAREAEDLRRFELQQARLDTQEAWQRQKYDESIRRQDTQDKLAAEDREWNRNRQTESDKRTKNLDEIAAQERAEKKAEKLATENFQQNFFNIADRAILGTTAGRAAENELLRRAMQETANIAKADEKMFGEGSVDKGSFRTPDPANITAYGNKLAIDAARPYADREELVRAMSPALKDTSIDPVSLIKATEALGVGVDTEALNQAREKQARELTNKIFSADGKGSVTYGEDGTLKVTTGTDKNQVSFVPTKLSTDESWFGMGDSAQKNIAEVAQKASLGSMSAAVRDKMLDKMLDAGYLKVGEGKLEEGKSISPDELKVIHRKVLEEVGSKPEAQDPLERWNSIYKRVKESSSDGAVDSAIAAKLKSELGNVSTGRDLYSALATSTDSKQETSDGITTQKVEEQISKQNLPVLAPSINQRLTEKSSANLNKLMSEDSRYAAIFSNMTTAGVDPKRARVLLDEAVRTNNFDRVGAAVQGRLTPFEKRAKDSADKDAAAAIKREEDRKRLEELKFKMSNNTDKLMSLLPSVDSMYSRNLFTPEELERMKEADRLRN